MALDARQRARRAAGSGLAGVAARRRPVRSPDRGCPPPPRPPTPRRHPALRPHPAPSAAPTAAAPPPAATPPAAATPPFALTTPVPPSPRTLGPVPAPTAAAD